jgi:hypothetical protein
VAPRAITESPNTSFGPVAQVDAGVLDVGYVDAGSADVHDRPAARELQWWYQYYFATERGRAGYDNYRREFAELIWRTASQKWNFDDATSVFAPDAFVDAIRDVGHGLTVR